MDGRIRKTCHICGKHNLLQLNNHLTQMHGWNSEQKKQYKLSQMGMGKKEDEDVGTISDSESTMNITDEVEDDESSLDISGDGEDEESDYGSEDEESDRVWREFRNDVTSPYSELFHEKLGKLKLANPNVSESDLKEKVCEKFKQVWIDDAAEYLKSIITYYEHFQSDDYITKILDMRDQMSEKREEQPLEMAINLYKSKLGSLFGCHFDIPE